MQDDVIVLCTDGLWDVVGRPEIVDHVATPRIPTATAESDGRRSLELALKRGAADNVTCLVVRITSDRPIPAAAAKRGFFRRGSS